MGKAHGVRIYGGRLHTMWLNAPECSSAHWWQTFSPNLPTVGEQELYTYMSMLVGFRPRPTESSSIYGILIMTN